MIQDKTIDEALIELMRCQRALEKLRAKRKESAAKYQGPVPLVDEWVRRDQVKEHAAAKRASLDLTRKLADLRAGR